MIGDTSVCKGYVITFAVSLVSLFYIILLCFIKIHNFDSYDQNEVYDSIKMYPKGKYQKVQEQ